MGKKTLAGALLGLLLIFGVGKAKAVYFASDTVRLYDNGQAVKDSSVFWVASYGTYYEVCEKGTCDIGQQFYPVTIYRTSYPDIYAYAGNRGEGRVCDDACRAKMKGLIAGTADKAVLDPVPAGNSINAGRVGQPRSYRYDLASKQIADLRVQNTSLEDAFAEYSLLIIAFLLGLVLAVYYAVVLMRSASRSAVLARTRKKRS